MTLRWKCIILGVELPRRENLERVVVTGGASRQADRETTWKVRPASRTPSPGCRFRNVPLVVYSDWAPLASPAASALAASRISTSERSIPGAWRRRTNHGSRLPPGS